MDALALMALATLTLNGDGTTTGWTRTPTSGTFFSKVQDIAGADGNTTTVESPNAVDGTIWFLLTAVPGDFDPAGINTITIRLQHRRDNVPVMAVDDATVTVLLVRADESTVMSSVPTAVATPISGSYTQTNFAPTPSGTHSLSDWDGVRLEIRFDHIGNQTPDTTNQMLVTAAEIEIDYTPVAGGSFLPPLPVPRFIRSRKVI